MAGLDTVLNAASPITSALGTVGGTIAPAAERPAAPEHLADIVHARDTVHDIKQDEKHPLWRRMLNSALTGAAIGGTTIGAKAAPFVAKGDNLTGGLVAGAATGAALGGLTGAGVELLDHITSGRRKRNAEAVLKNAPQSVFDRLREPDVAAPAREYHTSRDYPLRLAELGLVGGGLAGSIAGMAHPVATPNDHHVEAFGVNGPLLSEAKGAGKWGLIGSGVGSALGMLGGMWWRAHKRKQLVDALSKKTASRLTAHAVHAANAAVAPEHRDVADHLASLFGAAGFPDPENAPSQEKQAALLTEAECRAAAARATPEQRAAFEAERARQHAEVDSFHHGLKELLGQNKVGALRPDRLARLRARRCEIPKEHWLTLTSGTKVYLVPGEDVRNNILTEFIGGGHHLVYSWIPENEIWIDTGVPEDDRPFILVHEIYEIALMQRGYSYDVAHDAANEIEAEVRAMRKTAANDPRKPDEPGQITWPRTNGPTLPPIFRGWPIASSNTKMIQANARLGLERYSMGRIVHDKVAAAEKLRSRAEAVIYNEDGVVAIPRKNYVSFPGGGIDDGEEAEFAAIRESIEEADRKLLHIKPMGVTDMVWPKDQVMVEGYDGFKNYIFLALDGGKVGTKHEDNEDFKVIPFAEVESILEGFIAREDLAWSKEANEARLQVVREAADLAAAGSTKPVKLALAVPKQATDYFCGPACLHGILGHFKIAADQTKLAGELGTTEDGTKTASMLKVAAEKGLTPAAREGWTNEELQKAAATNPVLLLIRVKEAGTSDVEDHFVVATAADADGITISDPDKVLRKLSYATLDECWHSVDEPTARWAAEMKVADAASILPVSEFVHFNHEGKILVAPDENRRYKFPRTGKGKPAPYERAVRFVPPAGVPEPGHHGYDVTMHVGEGPVDETEFPGGEWKDPKEVTQNLYASMGLTSQNAHFRDLDRARARVILRAMKHRAKTAPAALPAPIQVPPQP